MIGKPWINRKCLEDAGSSSFCGRKVAWSWKVVVLCHPCDRSLLFGCHLLSLAFLEGGLAGHRGGGDSKTWLKEVSIVSLFSVMLMGTPGIGRAGLLKVSGNG